MPTGLLFGRLEDREISIETFRAFTSFDPDGLRGPGERLDSDLKQWFSAPKLDPQLANLELIGWYGISLDPRSALTDDAAQFHNRYFRRISDVALIASSDGNSEWLGFYTRWANTAMSVQRHRWARLQIPIGIPTTEPILVRMRSTAHEDSSVTEDKSLDSGHWVREKSQGISAAANAAEVAKYEQMNAGDQISADPNAPQPASANSPHTRLRSLSLKSIGFGYTGIGSKLRIILAVLGVAAVIGCIALYIGIQGRRTHAQFGLRVEPKEDALLVSWDPHSERLRSATGGTLEITDGSRHREMRLDSGELANGSVLYRPASADIVFRLSASSKNGATRSQDLRVEPRTVARLLNTAGNAQSSVRSEAKQPVRQTARRQPSSAFAKNGNGRPDRSDTHANARITNSAPATTQAPASRSAELRTPQVLNRVTERGQASHSAPPGLAHGKAVKPSAATSNLSNAQQSATVKSRRDDSRTGANNSASAKPAAGPQHMYVPPQPITKVMPNKLSQDSLGYKPIVVSVVVAIDEFGRVTEAHLANDASTENISLASAALSAAKQWIFQPATRDGRTVPSRHIIEFHFNARP